MPNSSLVSVGFYVAHEKVNPGDGRLLDVPLSDRLPSIETARWELARLSDIYPDAYIVERRVRWCR